MPSRLLWRGWQAYKHPMAFVTGRTRRDLTALQNLAVGTFACALMQATALAESAPQRMVTFAAEPTFGLVHTIDGSFGPSLVVEIGLQSLSLARLSMSPVIRLSAGYLGLGAGDEAIPITGSLGLTLRYDLDVVYVALQGLGGFGDGGGVASHGVQPLAAGGLSVEVDVTPRWRLALVVSTSALLGEKSVVWTTVGPRIALSL